jgi:predicted GH43/DUF377 family glycosyl hydrolase
MHNPHQLLTRSSGNPILTATDLPYGASSIFNPGAAQIGDETLLLARVEGLTGLSHLAVARSADGVSGWRFDLEHDLVPDPNHFPEDAWGLEDPRIVAVPELAGYLITFTSYSQSGPVVSLAFTADFRHFERRGIICPPDDKNAAIFPRRLRGRWHLIHRPIGPDGGDAHIVISGSDDLTHWGPDRVLLRAREGGWWDAHRIGLGPPPLETPEGWLVLYNAAKVGASGVLYRSGLALLDLEDPTRIIARSNEFVFKPEMLYERVGDIPNVVFPSGWIADPDGGLRIYYGAADTTICLAKAQLAELLDYLRESAI